MGIRNVVLARNVGLASLLCVSVLWAQQPTPGQGQTPPTRPSQPSPGREPQSGRPQRGIQPPRSPGQDPFGRNDPFGRFGGGISGRIVDPPLLHMRVDLYRDMMRVDSTITQSDGTFRFQQQQQQQSGRQYEVHVHLGNGWEYVEDVDFFGNVPATIIIQERGVRRGLFADSETTGSGTIVSLASLKVPEKARKEFNKARKAGRKKKYDEALQRLQKATEIYPEYAEAFNEMGAIYIRKKQKTEALKAFEHAIAADPNWVSAYVNLAWMQIPEPQRLLETSGKILQLYPTLGPGHFFRSYANLSLGRVEEAEKSALQADRHEHRQVPQIHLLLAQIYWQKGKLEKAEKQLRTFLQESPKAPNADQVRAGIAELQQAKAQRGQPER